VFTIGDDIAWLHPGADGRLWAINPEAGYFGVVPGTSPKTNRNAYEMIRRDTLYTNVAVTKDNEPWWEGRGDAAPALDWQARPFDPALGPAAHPNSRFTVAARNNPAYGAAANDPRGVPISALIFGGRRRELAPLVYEARDWQHGVLVAASIASETTAAAEGNVGVVRRDPMAMKPFCGYDFGDYFAHWLHVGAGLARPPRIFQVNWFRKDAAGKFLWPGFGENLRVLAWVLERCAGRGGAREAPIGNLPRPQDLPLQGLDISLETLAELTRVAPDALRAEAGSIRAYLRSIGARTPAALYVQLDAIEARLAG
jgi:phosphoenolpyruvate carboxykinase (GTP)